MTSRKKRPAQQANNVVTADKINYVKPVTDFPFVYANNVTMNLGNLDASLLFGEMVGEEDGKLVVIPKVKVVMALPFVKALTDLLDSEEIKQHFAKVAAEND